MSKYNKHFYFSRKIKLHYQTKKASIAHHSVVKTDCKLEVFSMTGAHSFLNSP
jgi:hypothetical protein